MMAGFAFGLGFFGAGALCFVAALVGGVWLLRRMD